MGKIWEVKLVEPPAPGKRKGWMKRFLVAAPSGDEAIDRLRESPAGEVWMGPEVAISVEEVEDGIYSLMSVRV